jgi:uncharacterized protein
MKHGVCILALVLLGFTTVHSQNAPYKVVFDLTSRDSLDQKAVLRWITEILSGNPDAELEVVMYGKGFEMALPEKSHFTDAVITAMTHPNVSFKVCEIAMKNNNVEKSQLTRGVQTVPDGVYEIISKQHEGWGYIKVGH